MSCTAPNRGWNDRRGTFTATFDGDDLNAALLTISATGLLAGDDPRVTATIDAAWHIHLAESGQPATTRTRA